MIFLRSIILVILIGITYLIIGNVFKEKDIKIPDEAIRFRVLASSNSDYDQSVKLKVKNEIATELSVILKGVDDYSRADKIIKENVDILNKKVEKVLEYENYQKGFELTYGMNYFPKKEFKGIEYEEGNYQSLVITLGEGLGNNWWCVLFPPLCLIEAEESTKVEYKIFVKEIMDKYL